MSEGEKPTEQDITLWTKEAADDIMAASESREPASDKSGGSGGGAPSLAAHSEVATTPGQTLSSGAHPPRASTESQVRGNVTGAAASAANSLGETALKVKDTAVEYGSRTAEKTTDYIQKQPLFTLALTGVVCLAIGAMLGRR